MKTIAVIGYGAQGRAQSNMLKESGATIYVGAREGGPSWQKATEDGHTVLSISEAAQKADIVHILIPDECHKKCYEDHIAPHMTAGKTLSFSHGFSIVFKAIVPPTDVDVIMVAPKAPGTEVYKAFKDGFGVPALISVYQDASGNAKETAMEFAKTMKYDRAGVTECSFAEEANEDLFGEQAVLCGGLAELIKAGFETLTERGYPAELAYYECLHEVKLITDLLYKGGIAHMYDVVSNTAEYGGRTRGPRLITPETKKEMHKILDEVESGQFAEEWMKEAETMENLKKMREEEAAHPIEVVGKEIRAKFKKTI